MQGFTLLNGIGLISILLQFILNVDSEFLTIAAIAAGVAYLKPSLISDVKNLYNDAKNSLGILGGESCSAPFITPDWEKMVVNLKNQVYGQELAVMNTYAAIKSHFQSNHKNKALALSFHGLPGTGKNYVVDIIISSLYKNGHKSRFVHKFNGRIHFPNEQNVHEYQSNLNSWIQSNVSQCAWSLFIFDEVDKFPKGLLNTLKPYVDHHSSFDTISFHKTIFVFISNKGGKEIMDRFMELSQSGYILRGKSRKDLSLNDFESVAKQIAFNEEGGFKMSDIIGHNVIDHYITFLPLEKEHVLKCIRNQFDLAKRDNGRVNKVPFDKLTQYVLASMTFGPEPDNLFSLSGCKRVQSKVGTFLEKYGIYDNF